MMKLNNIVPAALLSLLSATAMAQQTQHLTLQEAVQLGLQNSNSLHVSDAKIKEAEAQIDEATNRQLPDFKISGSYLRLTNANINFKAAQSQASSGSTGSGTAAKAPAPKANQAVYGMANLSWPIFAGGRIKYGIASSRYLLEAAKLSKANDQAGIAYNITQAYTNLFKATQMIKVVNENLRAAQQRDSQYIKLENNGIIPRNDRLKAQLQTSQIELQLLEAESNRALATTNMNILLGLPENTLLDIDTSYIANRAAMEDINFYETKALAGRNDVLANEYRQKAAALAVKSARAENLPTLALTGGYVAADIPKVLTITNALNAGLGVQYNIANLWKKNASLKQAQAQQAQLQAVQGVLQDNIKMEVNRDYEAALLADKKIALYEKANAQAQENYNIVNNKYKNGLATITDVLDANAALFGTQINIANAKADAALGYQKLLQTTGLINQ